MMSPERALRYARQRRDFALLMSMAWIIYGLVVLLTYPISTAQSLEWLPEGWGSSDLTGVYILVFGTVGLITAYLAQRNHMFETAAYATLFGAPVLLAIAFFIGAWIEYSDTGWAGGTRFLVMALPAAYVSGLRPSDAQINKAREAAHDGA